MIKENKVLSLEEWNAALVSAVFFKRSRSRTTLSRIDTTGRLLEQITGDKDRETAKQQFISAFGYVPADILKHFRWSPEIPLVTKRDGIPPTFAALYLTLLAASADDNTHAEGKFRSRFATLLQHDKLRHFNFDDLPVLWNQVALWSRLRAEQHGDCAKLLLPLAPQSERLIGHSKRLAFPTYKDEVHLRRVLMESKLDSESDFNSVNNAVHRSLKLFTDSFREEVAAFNTLVSRALNQAAYESPFWGAFRDITWEEEDKKLSKIGRFCLQLEATDPQSPELFLFIDEVGAKPLDENEKSKLDRPRDEYSLIWKSPDGQTLISSILSLVRRHKGFAQSRVGKSLLGGWLVLFQDSLGSMTSDGDYYDSGPACFIIRKDQVRALLPIFRRYDLKWSDIECNEVLGDWRGFFFGSLSRSWLEVIATALPDTARPFITKGWKPPQPHISGAARYGQSVLLNPASNPIVRLEHATSGRFKILGEGRLEVASGELVEDDEGFYIPPEKLIGINPPLTCLYSMIASPDGQEVMLEVPVLSEVPSRSFRPILQREEWLIDGCAGILEGISCFAEAAESRESRPIQAVPEPIGRPWPLLQDVGADDFAKCIPAAIESISTPFEWLSEALALRFQRRTTLPFKEIGLHTRMASEASGIAKWKLTRLLFAANWLQVLERRSAPYPIVAPADRTISYISKRNYVAARIVGMLSRLEQQDLLSKLGAGECATRLSVVGMDLSVGCIELQLSSADRVSSIARDLGLELLTKTEIQNPLGGVMHPMTQVTWTVLAPPRDAPIHVWDQQKHKWIEVTSLDYELPIATLLKTTGRQRVKYWAKAKGGYWTTDSSTWAWLVRTIVSGANLGKLAVNGDVLWSSQLNSLPTYLCRWWMHWGGGCVALAADGALVFVGGRGRQVWEDIAFPCRHQERGNAKEDRALMRRAMALRLRRAAH